MSSSEPVTKDLSWRTWIGVGTSVATVVGLGLTIHQIRIRSFEYAVEVGMKALQKGCSFTTMSDTLVSTTIGFVERPHQVYDGIFDLSSKSFASRPYVIRAPSGTGKSEYDLKKLEERGSHFLHLMCKESGGMNEPLVGSTLGIHSKQDENAYEICKKALSNLKTNQESPRCLVVVEDPTIDNVKEIQMLHEWNKGGLCDLVVVLSEKKDVDEILDAMHGKQGRPVKVEYLPPTKESFAETLKKSVEEGDSSFPFGEDDLMKLLDFVDVNFSDYDHGLEHLYSGCSVEDTMLKLTEDFRGDVESAITKGGIVKEIYEEELIEVLLDLQAKGFVTGQTNLRAVAHLVDENILRTVNRYYAYHKKGTEIGVVAFLESYNS